MASTGTAKPADAAPASRSSSGRVSRPARHDPTKRTAAKTTPPTRFCLKPSASPARSPAARATRQDRSRTATSDSPRLDISTGSASSSPFTATASMSTLVLSAAIATAVQRAACSSATSRATAAAASTSAAHAIAPSTRMNSGPPIASESLNSAIIGGGRSTK